MAGSRDAGVNIVNLTEISIMNGSEVVNWNHYLSVVIWLLVMCISH